MLAVLSLALLIQEPAVDLPAKARHYLESASGLVAATPQDFQAGALLQLGTVVATYDTKRALELYEQAFAASAVLPTQKDSRIKEEFQAVIASQIAKIDLDRALEVLMSLPAVGANEPDPRLQPITEIVRQFIARKKLDKAVETVDNLATLTGGFPYDAVTLILKALPPTDERVPLIYSQALALFQQRPETEPFTNFLRTFQKVMPTQTYELASRQLAKVIIDGHGLPVPYSQTISTNNGTVMLTDPRDIAVFNAFDLIAAVDPTWAKDYVNTHQDLKQAIERYPQGLRSLNTGAEGIITRGDVKPGTSKADIEARAQVLALETVKAQEAMRNLEKDPAKSLESIKQIPTPQLQVRMLSTVAAVAGQKDPAEAATLLTKVVAALDDMKAPEWRANGWGAVAMTAAKIKDNELALKALTRGLADAKEMYKIDANADDPNIAPRASWPSTMIYKQLFFRAAKCLGEGADGLLEKIPDTEIQIMARTEMAAAWLDAPPSPWFTQVKRAPR